jgi:hypothetical protein
VPAHLASLANLNILKSSKKFKSKKMRLNSPFTKQLGIQNRNYAGRTKPFSCSTQKSFAQKQNKTLLFFREK